MVTPAASRCRRSSNPRRRRRIVGLRRSVTTSPRLVSRTAATVRDTPADDLAQLSHLSPPQAIRRSDWAGNATRQDRGSPSRTWSAAESGRSALVCGLTLADIKHHFRRNEAPRSKHRSATCIDHRTSAVCACGPRHSGWNVEVGQRGWKPYRLHRYRTAAHCSVRSVQRMVRVAPSDTARDRPRGVYVFRRSGRLRM